MSTLMNGRGLSATEFLSLMRSDGKAGDEEYRRTHYNGKPLVRVGDCLVTEETAKELEGRA